MKASKLWLVFAIITTSFWGVWGALISLPEKAGFPATLSYVVWALTMILPALVALKVINWKLDYDKRSILLGSIVGFLGAGGQIVLFQTLRMGPAYLVFPFISLSPLVTIILAKVFLKEKTGNKGWVGIILALIALPLLSYQFHGNSATSGYLWIILSIVVLLAWGIQAYVIRFANETMKAESIFFYMMITGIILIPIALLMTDFSKSINWGFKGPYLAAIIQILNAIGALTLVYAFRYGKAIIVSPMANALAPVITIIISLAIYAVVPSSIKIIGMVMAVIAALLMGLEEDVETDLAVETEK